jgi:hypothetical protein
MDVEDFKTLYERLEIIKEGLFNDSSRTRAAFHLGTLMTDIQYCILEMEE